MLALKIVGGVILFLLLLLLIPLRAKLRFQNEFVLYLRYAFFQFCILPGREKPQAEEVPKSEEEKGKGTEKLRNILKAKGFFGFLQALFELIGIVLQSGKRIVKRIKLKRFDLYLCLGGKEDAAEAAVSYGKLSAAVYSACGAFFALKKCRKKAVTVDLDYNSCENTVNFSGTVSVLPLFVLKEGISLLIKGLPKVLNLLRAAGPSKKERISQMRKQGDRQ